MCGITASQLYASMHQSSYSSQMDGQTTRNIMPPATAIAGAEA